MRVRVDEDRCIGAGLCALTAPDVFDQRDDDGVVRLLVDSPPPDAHEAVREAEVRCPALVISIEED
jgi:ferredoxin